MYKQNTQRPNTVTLNVFHLILYAWIYWLQVGTYHNKQTKKIKIDAYKLQYIDKKEFDFYLRKFQN